MTTQTPAAQEMLDSFMERLIRTGKAPVPFVILAGTAGSGKTQMALGAAHKLLGAYARNDLLTLYDCSRELEKPHVIKISSDEVITRTDGTVVQDRGIREVHQRFAKSAAGQWKVLLIEHIDRLNEASANALLKICEEPLPHRLIVATTSQKE
jgi:DNA polymerase III delta prime subunit